MRFNLRVFLGAALILFLASCGGGGGGSDDVALKGAEASIDADPRDIRVGDRTLVTIQLDEVDVNGVIVKIRYPEALEYIEDTSFLEDDESIEDVGPIVNRATNNKVYLVYYFSRDSFDEDGSGKLTFQLRGLSRTSEAEIEIDLDLHDPSKDPRDEFRLKNPLYSAEDLATVEVQS